MKTKNIFYLSKASFKKRRGSFWTLILTLLISQLFFFSATSFITSITNIISNKESNFDSDYIITINPVVESQIYFPFTTSELSEIAEHEMLSMVVNYAYFDDSLSAKSIVNSIEIPTFLCNGVDVNFDSYNRKKYIKYEQAGIDFIKKGRDFIKDDKNVVLVDEAFLAQRGISYYEGMEITHQIPDASGNMVSIVSKAIGAFNPIYTLQYSDQFLISPPISGSTPFIFSADIIEFMNSIHNTYYLKNYTGQRSLEISFAKLSDVLNFHKKWENTYGYSIDSPYLAKNSYLTNLNAGFSVLIIISLIIFCITLINLINNIIIMLIEQIKTYGFFLSIGMKKIDIFKLFYFQVLIMFFISTIIALLLLHLFFPFLQQMIRSNFGYYLTSSDHFAINYLFIIICSFITLSSLTLSAFIPIKQLLKKEELKLMKNET